MIKCGNIVTQCRHCWLILLKQERFVASTELMSGSQQAQLRIRNVRAVNRVWNFRLLLAAPSDEKISAGPSDVFEIRQSCSIQRRSSVVK